ncbi:MAG: hypothetical protein ACLGHC_00020 [Alphaproteobacteria bacterium]
MKQKLQSPAGLGGSKERDWGLAGVALLVTSALLTGLLLIGIEKDWGGLGGRPPVTVQPASDGNGPQTARPGRGTVAWPDTGESPGQMLAEGLVLEPRFIDGRVAGYLVSPKSSPPILAAAKLRPGDLVIEVDSRPLHAATIGELRRDLPQADSVEFTFQRDGHIRKRVINLRG